MNTRNIKTIMKLAGKFLTIILVATAAALAAGCTAADRSSANGANGAAPNTDAGVAEVRPAAGTTPSGGAPSAFRAELKTEPAEVRAGQPAALDISIKDVKRGGNVRDLAIVHEKPMHLLIVSNDLNEFYHVHPEPQEDGTYRVSHTFPAGGAYKLYADFTPPGAEQVVEHLNLMVAGDTRPAVALVADESGTKTVDGLRVTMKPDKSLRAGEELMLDFAVADAGTGKPVTDLQPYLGALAHFVLISEDGTDFLHAHPMEKTKKTDTRDGGGGGAHEATLHSHGEKTAATGDKNTPQASASEVSAHTSFPRPGLYKIWAQFQRGGRVSTVPFVVRVAAAATTDAEATARAADGDSSPPVSADGIKVTVSAKGYEPARLEVKKGQPVKIMFYRPDAGNCGGEVVFPKLGIRKKLPVGKTTVVEVTPKESGELAFNCGMGMLRGALVVSQ